jgi:hypothetical protein
LIEVIERKGEDGSMKSVVTGLMMLAGAMVREKGEGVDDFGWRREVQEARDAHETTAGSTDGATTGATNDSSSTIVVAAPAGGTAGESAGPVMSNDATFELAPGDWGVACERNPQSRLVFDRASVRGLGAGTLFRWSPIDGTAPTADDVIYTAVADCRGKSIEATWPGKRSTTRVGSCGRMLVESVCALRTGAKSALRRARGNDRDSKVASRASGRGAPHASATP